jgi:hypothetical protein
MAETPAIEPDGDDPGCSWCERGSGVILVLGAAGLLYIGLDLISGGALSRLFAGQVRAVAEAVDPPFDGDGDGGPGAEIAAAGDDGTA